MVRILTNDIILEAQPCGLCGPACRVTLQLPPLSCQRHCPEGGCVERKKRSEAQKEKEREHEHFQSSLSRHPKCSPQKCWLLGLS